MAINIRARKTRTAVLPCCFSFGSSDNGNNLELARMDNRAKRARLNRPMIKSGNIWIPQMAMIAKEISR